MPVARVETHCRFSCGPLPLATFALRVAAVAERHGLDVDHWIEDGLGDAFGFLFRSPEGHVFLLYELLPVVNRGELQLTLEGDGVDITRHGADMLIDEVVAALDLDPASLTWRVPANI